MRCASSVFLLAVSTGAREIVFPPVSGYTTDQAILGGYNDPDISQPKFAGLMTYANLPYVHCLAADGEEVETFDIAILGAPFDTVSCVSSSYSSRWSERLSDLKGTFTCWCTNYILCAIISRRK